MLRAIFFPLLLLCVAAHQPHDNTAGLAVSPNGQVIFTLSRGRLYRSDDAGLTWQIGQGPGLPFKIGGQLNVLNANLAISPAYSQDTTVHLVALIKSEKLQKFIFYTSRNRGGSWSESSGLGTSNGNHVIVAALSTVLVVVPSFGEVVLSHDHGASFSRLPGTGFSAAAAACGSNKKCVLFLGKDNGQVLGSMDDGASWVEIGNCKSKVAALAPASKLSVGLGGGQFFVHAACLSRKVLRISAKVSESSFQNITQSISQVAPLSFASCGGRPSRPLQSCFTVTSEGSNVFAATDVLLVSDGFGGAWKKRTANVLQASQWGLYRSIQRLDLPTFTYVGAAYVGNKKMFLGSQSGIFKSTNEGSVWKKMDIQLPSITGVQAAVAGTNKLKLGACTYSAGCWTGIVDLVALQKGTGSAAMSSWSLVPTTGRYNIMAMSPDFENDGIMLITGKNQLIRSVNGGISFEQAKVPLLINGVQAYFQSVAFSPNFKYDGIVFAGGYNVGVVISRDRGATFKLAWDADWPIYGGSYVQLALSPMYKDDQMLIATTVTFRPPIGCTPCQTTDIPGCSNIPIKPGQRFDKRSDNKCYHSFDMNQGRGAKISLSKNGGKTWKLVSPLNSPGRWNGDAFLVQKAEGGIAIVGAETGKLLYNPTLTHNGWCEVSGTEDVFSDAKVGRNGLSVHSHAGKGTVLVGWRGTGTTLGEIDSQCRFIPRTSNRGSLDVDAAKGKLTRPWAFEQSGLPGSDHMRGLGDLIAFSPNYAKDGIAFGASAFEILASTDRGATWQAIQGMVQVQRHNCWTVGCAVCRTSSVPKQQFTDGDVNNNSDVGQYCIRCKACFKRSVYNGSCQKIPGCLI